MRICKARNRLYHNYIATLMRRGFLGGPGVSEEEKRLLASEVRSLYDFDRLIVAPRFGFSSAEDYYEASSAKRFLALVRTPLLLIQADDDPWIPHQSYESVDWGSLPSYVRLVMTRGGGHVGFHGKGSDEAWHDRAAAAFFERALSNASLIAA